MVPLKGFEYNFHSTVGDLYETDMFHILGEKVTPSFKEQAWLLSSEQRWFQQSGYCTHYQYKYKVYVKMQLRD